MLCDQLPHDTPDTQHRSHLRQLALPLAYWSHESDRSDVPVHPAPLPQGPGTSGTPSAQSTRNNQHTPATAATTTWASVTGADPEHSQRYIARWEAIEGGGGDIDGEARLIDAMAPRGARILDAGAGTGRVAAHLSALGHQVSAVDIDPQLVAYARQRYTDAEESVGLPIAWHTGDLPGIRSPPPLRPRRLGEPRLHPGRRPPTALGMLASRLDDAGRPWSGSLAAARYSGRTLRRRTADQPVFAAGTCSRSPVVRLPGNVLVRAIGGSRPPSR